jgi:hypothetical protein
MEAYVDFDKIVHTVLIHEKVWTGFYYFFICQFVGMPNSVVHWVFQAQLAGQKYGAKCPLGIILIYY